MGYPLSLDEMSGEAIKAELDGRARARAAGNCDYCGRPAGSEPACRFPERHGGNEMDQKALDNLFTYHAPKGDQADRYVKIRDAGKALAQVIVETTPTGADQDAAVRKVREAVMTANAAIACNE